MSDWRSCRVAREAAVETDSNGPLIELWEPVWDTLPAEIVRPWRQCRFGGHLEIEGDDLHCNGHAEHSENGLVVFELAYTSGFDANLFPWPQYLFGGPRLLEDLRVTGARCKEAWRKGKKLRYLRSYGLECERSGRSPVEIEALARKSACRVRFPAVGEPPGSAVQ